MTNERLKFEDVIDGDTIYEPAPNGSYYTYADCEHVADRGEIHTSCDGFLVVLTPEQFAGSMFTKTKPISKREQEQNQTILGYLFNVPAPVDGFGMYRMAKDVDRGVTPGLPWVTLTPEQREELYGELLGYLERL